MELFANPIHRLSLNRHSFSEKHFAKFLGCTTSYSKLLIFAHATAGLRTDDFSDITAKTRVVECIFSTDDPFDIIATRAGVRRHN